MPFTLYRLSQESRLVLFQARYVASQMGSDEVKAAHLVIGMLDKAEDLGLILDEEGSRNFRQVLEQLEQRAAPTSTEGEMPVSADCRDALEEAELLRSRDGSDLVTPAHILATVRERFPPPLRDLLDRCGISF